VGNVNDVESIIFFASVPVNAALATSAGQLDRQGGVYIHHSLVAWKELTTKTKIRVKIKNLRNLALIRRRIRERSKEKVLLKKTEAKIFHLGRSLVVWNQKM